MAPCHQPCYGLFHCFHNKRNYHASHLLAHFFYYGILLDALAIGISFAFVGMNSFTSILSPIVIIGFTSFVISTLGSLIGVFCGKRFNLRMELWGGLVLIIIGVKILIEHLFLS